LPAKCRFTLQISDYFVFTIVVVDGKVLYIHTVMNQNTFGTQIVLLWTGDFGQGWSGYEKAIHSSGGRGREDCK